MILNSFLEQTHPNVQLIRTAKTDSTEIDRVPGWDGIATIDEAMVTIAHTNFSK